MRGLVLNDITSAAIGRNVRRARRYQGMTLEVLAGRIGMSKGWLSMVENGRPPLDKRPVIARIAEVLEVSADTLLGGPAPEVAPDGPAYSLKPLREVLLDATLDDPPDVAARPVPVLGELAGQMDSALRRADYGTLHRELPGLLGELQVHAAASGAGPDRDEALRLLILASASATIGASHSRS